MSFTQLLDAIGVTREHQPATASAVIDRNHQVRQNGGWTMMSSVAPFVFQTPSLLAAITLNL
jgi:hypothetical protein